MTSQLNPYLNFKDNAREAMQFYQSVFGGELSIATFGDFNAAPDPAEKDKVMHAQLEAGDGITIMAADTPNSMEYRPMAGFSMSLSGNDQARLAGYFEKLAAGGQVIQPLAKADWGDTFGMCVDRFGVSWLVNISAAE